MILVTGAAGFIGSNLCHFLCDQGRRDIIALDALKTGSNLDNIRQLPVVFKKINLLSDIELLKLFEEYDINQVVHLAAESHVDRSIGDDKTFWLSNVVGTSNLMRACKDHPVDIIINQITDEVYGPKPTKSSLEGDLLRPTSPYAASKAGQYYVGKSFHITYGLPVISTFPANCFGPYQYPEKIIPKFIGKLLDGEKVPLMKSTHFERDWLPVYDMCAALYFLLKNGKIGEDYNIGADNHLSNWDLTIKLLTLLGKKMHDIEIVPDRAAHDCRYAVNSNKIKGLGFQISKDFDSYLSYTVDYFKGIHDGV